MPTLSRGEQAIPAIRIDGRWEVPAWALLQRLLLDTMNHAAVEFVQRYTREDGSLIWRDEWPGMDGSDDAYESFQNFPLLYALGGSEEVHQLARKLWDAITWQWTEYGQIYREFDGNYDWMHHGEGYLYFYLLGLAGSPTLKERQRAIRFAGLYTGDDPEAHNYDRKKKLIRSPITGSRGPHFVQTAEDWSTHRTVLDGYPAPFEDLPGVTGPKCQWSDDGIYAQILQRINTRWSRGDVPLNLTSTSLVTHAFLHTGEERYRQWVMEYLAAWEERTRRNNGIIPDNVGLSDRIGENLDGKWWGGYYGWYWPHGSFNILEPLLIAGCNATLLDGDTRHLDLFRSQWEMLWRQGREQDGRWLVPHKHNDQGWYNFYRPRALYPIYCWWVSMADEDLERVKRALGPDPKQQPTMGRHNKGSIANNTQWFQYIQGDNPDYPEQILRTSYQWIHERLTAIRADTATPDEMDVHHWQDLNPVVCEGLVQLTMGAPMHIYHGGLLLTRLRYYDAQARRPGLPPAVGALVERLSADAVTLCLVNLDLAQAREVIIQAGAFGEHNFTGVTVYNHAGEPEQQQVLASRWLRVTLSPGAGTRLVLQQQRFAHTPSYATPWTTLDDGPTPIRGRNLTAEQ